MHLKCIKQAPYFKCGVVDTFSFQKFSLNKIFRDFFYFSKRKIPNLIPHIKIQIWYLFNKKINFHDILYLTKIERKLIVNEISLKKFLTYTYSVYDIGDKFNKLERISNKNLKIVARPKTKASTGAKMIMLSCLCNHDSINELNVTTHDMNTSLKHFFGKKEYIPKTHGLRDFVIETDTLL